MKAEQLLNEQLNKEVKELPKERLVKEVNNTPFFIRKFEEKWIITLREYRITSKEYESSEEAEKELKSIEINRC